LAIGQKMKTYLMSRCEQDTSRLNRLD